MQLPGSPPPNPPVAAGAAEGAAELPAVQGAYGSEASSFVVGTAGATPGLAELRTALSEALEAPYPSAAFLEVLVRVLQVGHSDAEIHAVRSALPTPWRVQLGLAQHLRPGGSSLRRPRPLEIPWTLILARARLNPAAAEGAHLSAYVEIFGAPPANAAVIRALQRLDDGQKSWCLAGTMPEILVHQIVAQHAARIPPARRALLFVATGFRDAPNRLRHQLRALHQHLGDNPPTPADLEALETVAAWVPGPLWALLTEAAQNAASLADAAEHVADGDDGAASAEAQPAEPQAALGHGRWVDALTEELSHMTDRPAVSVYRQLTGKAPRTALRPPSHRPTSLQAASDLLRTGRNLPVTVRGSLIADVAMCRSRRRNREVTSGGAREAVALLGRCRPGNRGTPLSTCSELRDMLRNDPTLREAAQTLVREVPDLLDPILYAAAIRLFNSFASTAAPIEPQRALRLAVQEDRTIPAGSKQALSRAFEQVRRAAGDLQTFKPIWADEAVILLKKGDRRILEVLSSGVDEAEFLRLCKDFSRSEDERENLAAAVGLALFRGSVEPRSGATFRTAWLLACVECVLQGLRPKDASALLHERSQHCAHAGMELMGFQRPSPECLFNGFPVLYGVLAEARTTELDERINRDGRTPERALRPTLWHPTAPVARLLHCDFETPYDGPAPARNEVDAALFLSDWQAPLIAAIAVDCGLMPMEEAVQHFSPRFIEHWRRRGGRTATSTRTFQQLMVEGCRRAAVGDGWTHEIAAAAFELAYDSELLMEAASALTRGPGTLADWRRRLVRRAMRRFAEAPLLMTWLIGETVKWSDSADRAEAMAAHNHEAGRVVFEWLDRCPEPEGDVRTLRALCDAIDLPSDPDRALAALFADATAEQRADPVWKDLVRRSAGVTLADKIDAEAWARLAALPPLQRAVVCGVGGVPPRDAAEAFFAACVDDRLSVDARIAKLKTARRDLADPEAANREIRGSPLLSAEIRELATRLLREPTVTLFPAILPGGPVGDQVGAIAALTLSATPEKTAVAIATGSPQHMPLCNHAVVALRAMAGPLTVWTAPQRDAFLERARTLLEDPERVDEDPEAAWALATEMLDLPSSPGRERAAYGALERLTPRAAPDDASAHRHQLCRWAQVVHDVCATAGEPVLFSNPEILGSWSEEWLHTDQVLHSPAHPRIVQHLLLNQYCDVDELSQSLATSLDPITLVIGAIMADERFVETHGGAFPAPLQSEAIQGLLQSLCRLLHGRAEVTYFAEGGVLGAALVQALVDPVFETASRATRMGVVGLAQALAPAALKKIATPWAPPPKAEAQRGLALQALMHKHSRTPDQAARILRGAADARPIYALVVSGLTQPVLTASVLGHIAGAQDRQLVACVGLHLVRAATSGNSPTGNQQQVATDLEAYLPESVGHAISLATPDGATPWADVITAFRRALASAISEATREALRDMLVGRCFPRTPVPGARADVELDFASAQEVLRLCARNTRLPDLEGFQPVLAPPASSQYFWAASASLCAHQFRAIADPAHRVEVTRLLAAGQLPIAAFRDCARTLRLAIAPQDPQLLSTLCAHPEVDTVHWVEETEADLGRELALITWPGPSGDQASDLRNETAIENLLGPAFVMSKKDDRWWQMLRWCAFRLPLPAAVALLRGHGESAAYRRRMTNLAANSSTRDVTRASTLCTALSSSEDATSPSRVPSLAALCVDKLAEPALGHHAAPATESDSETDPSPSPPMPDLDPAT